MTIEDLHERGCSNREIARQLGVNEKTLRYRLRRLAEGAADGRAGKPFVVEALDAVIRYWIDGSSMRRRVNLQTLHEHLVAEHGYAGSDKSIQRIGNSKPLFRSEKRHDVNERGDQGGQLPIPPLWDTGNLLRRNKESLDFLSATPDKYVSSDDDLGLLDRQLKRSTDSGFELDPCNGPGEHLFDHQAL